MEVLGLQGPAPSALILFANVVAVTLVISLLGEAAHPLNAPFILAALMQAKLASGLWPLKQTPDGSLRSH